MDSIYRDLLIGTIGSVFGALIVYFGNRGLSFTKRARIENANRREKERALWKTRKIQVRMEITNNYLFAILKDFLIGSVLTIVPGAFGYLASWMAFQSDIRYLQFLSPFYVILAGVTLLGLVYYFLALGKALRYLKIRTEDESYLDSYLEEPVIQE